MAKDAAKDLATGLYSVGNKGYQTVTNYFYKSNLDYNTAQTNTNTRASTETAVSGK